MPDATWSAGRRATWPAWASAGLLTGVNVSVLASARLPFLGAAAGFWFLLVYPVYLLYTTSAWRGCAAGERLGYSLTAILLLLMVTGLAVDVVLPPLGDSRPLGPVTVLILGDAITAALILIRRRYPGPLSWRAPGRAVGPAEGRLLAGAGFSVTLAVLGANRINNGAGDQVSLLALGGLAVLLVLLLRWHREVRDAIISATLYLLSLTLLLMTSLRGWYVTGHDVQSEYRVFQLTAARSEWSIAGFRNAYNACLSITILPTELARVTGVDGPQVYKVLFQIIFAACPVLVYAISRRHWSVPVSVLAAMYFISFPTFFTDMPFLNRQEVAFLFVCAAILAITQAQWSLRRRRMALLVAAAGIELSHYSTMYIFLGTLLLSWVVQRARLPRRRRRGAGQRPRRPGSGARARRARWGGMRPAVGLTSLLLVAAIAFLWGDLATRTAGNALADAESAVTALGGHGGSARSGAVSYALLGGQPPSSAAVLARYRRETLRIRAAAPAGTYLPATAAARYQAPIANGSPPMPLTGAGRVLAGLGVPVAGLNSLVRQAAAKGEQIFAGLGLLVIALLARLRRRVGYEFFCLCAGSTAMVAIITLLPNLSTDYGVLRAFQEALILIAPVIVAGSLAAFSFLGRIWAPRAAAAVCTGILVSTTGLLPQLTGGFPAQLSLNNGGTYYDIYYTHPQEAAAVRWLQGRPGVLPDGLQAENYTEQFYFTNRADVTGQQFITDIYPPLIRRASWVLLSFATVRTGLATVVYDDDILTYSYPVDFLRDSKDLVYDNGGAQIYR